MCNVNYLEKQYLYLIIKMILVLQRRIKWHVEHIYAHLRTEKINLLLVFHTLFLEKH